MALDLTGIGSTLGQNFLAPAYAGVGQKSGDLGRTLVMAGAAGLALAYLARKNKKDFAKDLKAFAVSAAGLAVIYGLVLLYLERSLNVQQTPSPG